MATPAVARIRRLAAASALTLALGVAGAGAALGEDHPMPGPMPHATTAGHGREARAAGRHVGNGVPTGVEVTEEGLETPERDLAPRGVWITGLASIGVLALLGVLGLSVKKDEPDPEPVPVPAHH